jgi:hypothetical protein
MRNLRNLEMLATGALLAILTSAAKADTFYDFTYTQTGATSAYGSPASGTVTDATGTLDVSGNLVIGGTLTVTGTGPDNGSYVLVPASGSDSLVVYDHSWPIDTVAGLLWTATGTIDSGTELNMWYTGGGEYGQQGGYYALWGGSSPDSSIFNVESYGNATFTDPPSAPDGGMTVGLLGGSLLGLQAMRRKFFC